MLHERSMNPSTIQTNHAVLPQRVKRRRGAGGSASEERGREQERDGAAGEGPSPAPAGDPAPVDPLRASAAHAHVVKSLLKDVRGTRERVSRQFEYLDHTADVQLHAWGKTLSQAFEQVAACMFNYMTPLEGIEAGLRARLGEVAPDEEEGKRDEGLVGDTSVVRVITVEDAKDMDSLMFQWLDELLFGFSTEYFVPVRIRVVELRTDGTGGGSFGLVALAVGGVFDAKRDVCGTEIKAITYSAMQILDVCEGANANAGGQSRMTPLDRADVYVIVDI